VYTRSTAMRPNEVHLRSAKISPQMRWFGQENKYTARHWNWDPITTKTTAKN